MHIAVMSFLSLCYGLSFWDYRKRWLGEFGQKSFGDKWKDLLID